MSIPLTTLSYIVFGALLAVLVVYLIITLKNANEILDNVRKITEDNQSSIKDTVDNLAEITANVDKITKEVNNMAVIVKGGVEKTDKTISHIEAGVKDSVNTVKNNVDELASYISTLSKVIESFVSIFGKRK